MRHMQKNYFLLVVLSIFITSFVSATGTQSIVGTIDEDLNVNFNQSLPVDTNEYGSVDVAIPQNIGYMKAKYNFLSAYDAKGKATIKPMNNGILRLTFNEFSKGVQDMNVNFETTPSFNTPVFAGYDFTVFTDDPFLKSPSLKITYPSSLEFIGSSPRSSASQSVQISYPESKYAGPIYLNFLKNPLPQGYIRKESGIFTLVGTEKEVTILERTVQNLTFIPEMYAGFMDDFPLDRIWIITADLSGRGDFFTESGGFARDPHVIIMERSMLMQLAQKQFPDLQAMIVHEIAHHVVNKKVFGGQQKRTNWFDEGIATFFQLYAADTYFNKEGYWVVNGEVLQSTFKFTKDELKKRYQGQFYFDVPMDTKSVNDFYAHSGLVFFNFYLLTGKEGMRKLFDELSELQPSDDSCVQCDTQKILKIMESISGKSEQEILFPYKNDPDFDIKITPLTRKEITPSQASQIIADDYTSSPAGQSLVHVLSIIFMVIEILILGAMVFGVIWLVKRKKKNKG